MTTKIVVTCDICEKEITPANSYTVVSPLVYDDNESDSYAKYFNLCSIECLASFSQSLVQKQIEKDAKNAVENLNL